MLKKLFYLSLFTLSLGQLTAISKIGESSIYIFDIVVGIFAIYGVIYFLLVKKSFKFPKNSVLFLFFTFSALISLLLVIPNFSGSELTMAAFYLIRWGVYLLSSLVIFNMVDSEILTFEGFQTAIIYSGIFLAVAGFIQLAVLPDFTKLDEFLGWDPHKNRLASTFFDPNFVGAYFVVCLTILLDKMFTHRYPRRMLTEILKQVQNDRNGQHSKRFGSTTQSRSELVSEPLKVYIPLTILLVALILTFSRSAWGMFGVVILVYGVFKSRFLLVLSLLVAFSAYFFIPRIQTRISGITDPSDSASLRVISWKNTVEIIKENPVFGVGFNTFRYVQKDYGFLTPDDFLTHSGAGSDSSLLFVLATTGVFGFIFYFLGFIFPVLNSLWKKNVRSLLLLSLTVGFFLESQFINSLFYPQIMFVLFPILFIL